MKYIEKPYNERQYLMVLNDARGAANNEIEVFSRHYLPEGMKFVGGRPKTGELYVAHPSNQGLYVPYTAHEELYFNDKIHELSVLLQALGATEVDIVWKKGRSASEVLKESMSVGGEASFKKIGASANYSLSGEQRQKSANDRSIHLNVRSEALHKPFVPEGLVWYHEESAWQQMVKQRLLGMTSYSLRVSSKDEMNSSARRQESLKASLKALLLSVSMKYTSEDEAMFEAQEETEWIVNIQFRPLSEYKEEESRPAPKKKPWYWPF